MSGKLQIDRFRETRKVPRIFLEHSERLARPANVRDADDPVAGARPAASGAKSEANDDPAGERFKSDSPEHA